MLYPKINLLYACVALFLFLGNSLAVAAKLPQPNFIIILADDQGYNDLGCFGSEKIKTPHIDQMAVEGIRLTSFYAAAPLCGPSRASLLTGCYSQRIAEPNNRKNLHTLVDGSEILISEVLKSQGYATACIGKWHLAGSGKGGVKTNAGENLERYRLAHPSMMPLQQGFDTYFGTPYSNDMKPSVLVLPRSARPKDLQWYNRFQEEVESVTLYNLKTDVGETTNVASQHPEVVERLMNTVRTAQADLGDASRKISGSGIHKLK